MVVLFLIRLNLTFSQALDKSQLGEIIRAKGEKLDTPGKKPPKTGIFPLSFFHLPQKEIGMVKYCATGRNIL